jgi:integrase
VPAHAGGRGLETPKTPQSHRRILLTPQAVAALRAHRVKQMAQKLAAGPKWQESGLVFSTIYGTPLDRTAFRRQHFLPVLRKSGLPHMRPHDLRHTTATLLLANGVPVKMVSEMLGHANASITHNVYSHVTPSMQQQAVETMAAIMG